MKTINEFEADNKLNDWIGLFNFIQFLLDEEYITQQTYENQMGKLMTFKNYAYGEK